MPNFIKIGRVAHGNQQNDEFKYFLWVGVPFKFILYLFLLANLFEWSPIWPIWYWASRYSISANKCGPRSNSASPLFLKKRNNPWHLFWCSPTVRVEEREALHQIWNVVFYVLSKKFGWLSQSTLEGGVLLPLPRSVRPRGMSGCHLNLLAPTGSCSIFRVTPVQNIIFSSYI